MLYWENPCSNIPDTRNKIENQQNLNLLIELERNKHSNKIIIKKEVIIVIRIETV